MTVAELGDDWFQRNRNELGVRPDPVSAVIDDNGVVPTSVLEVGCANGWRLKRLQRRYDCAISGVDPSPDAVADAAMQTVLLGTADFLPFPDEAFDLVILGFCMYLCEPRNLFKIVAESDRVLRDGGFIIIHDFLPSAPFKVPYRYKKGVWSYHFNQPSLWLGSPVYSFRGGVVGTQDDCASMLRKDLVRAFPTNERMT